MALYTKESIDRVKEAVDMHALVSERTDQIYEHTILTRRDRKITAGWLDALLDRLEADGRLETLWRRSGIIA